MLKIKQQVSIGLLTIICGFTVQAHAQQSLVRVMDGRNLTCAALYDVGNDIYEVLNTTISQTDSMVFVSATLRFYSCAQNRDGSFAWQARSALQPIVKTTPDSGKQIVTVIHGIQALISNKNSQIIRSTILVNSVSQTIQLQLPKETLLTQDEVETLQNAGEVIVRPDLFLLADTESFIDGTTVDSRVNSSGLYRLAIRIQKK